MLTRDFFFVGTGPQGTAVVLGAAGALLRGEPSEPSWAKAAFPIRITPIQTPSFRAFIVIKNCYELLECCNLKPAGQDKTEASGQFRSGLWADPEFSREKSWRWLANSNLDIISSAKQ
jgi:hypothetical protein